VSGLQHPDSRSFERVADLYERVRPEYPPDAIAWLVERLDLRAGRTVLDLGAGTGKLTRALVQTGAEVIAVEPGEAMLAELRQAVPEARAVLGAAERIPLADDSIDAVTVGQAFHWFRFDEAVPELHRVLRPGGGVGLLWNNRDQDDALQREITELLAPFVPSGRAVAYDSSRFLGESPRFEPLEEREFRFAQELDADGLAGRVLSISFVAAAPAERRADLERRIRDTVAARGGTVTFPYVTSVYVSRAV
jgi:ubiquinone/menaquinone biosynthesis C-methylase UbiE